MPRLADGIPIASKSLLMPLPLKERNNVLSSFALPAILAVISKCLDKHGIDGLAQRNNAIWVLRGFAKSAKNSGLPVASKPLRQLRPHEIQYDPLGVNAIASAFGKPRHFAEQAIAREIEVWIG